MISFDANILFSGLEASARGHVAARNYLQSLQQNEEVMICELVLLELYTSLRNPSICARPLSNKQAESAIQTLRHHPAWRLVDYAPAIIEDLWSRAARVQGRLHIYDARMALTLRHHGVTEFATRNVKDFQDYGFQKVWDPCGSEKST